MTGTAYVRCGDDAICVGCIATNDACYWVGCVKQLTAVDGVFAARYDTAIINIGDLFVAGIDTSASYAWTASDGKAFSTIVAGAGTVSDAGASTGDSGDIATVGDGDAVVV